MSDNKNNEDTTSNNSSTSSSGDVFYDLERDDGHLKAKTEKEKELEIEKEEKKREKEILIALEKQALENKEIKDPFKEKLENLEKDLKPIKEVQEVKVSQKNAQETSYRTSPVHGIDAEIQHRKEQRKLESKNKPPLISDAGSAGTIRTPSLTPPFSQPPSQGIKK